MYLVSIMYHSWLVQISQNTPTLTKKSDSTTNTCGSYSNYSALEAVFAARVSNLNTTTSKSKYMYSIVLTLKKGSIKH